MRADMDRVVIERPRWGSSRSYHEVRSRENRADADDLPSKRSMKRPYRERHISKEFSDLLGPLQRYLEAQVGRPWDKVYADIRENLNPSSTTHIHIVDHLRRMVTIHVAVNDNGALVDHDRGPFYNIGKGELYVDPFTGILLRNKQRTSRPDYKAQRDAEIAKLYRCFGPEREAFKINGIWYWTVYKTVPEAEFYWRVKPDGTKEHYEMVRYQQDNLLIPTGHSWSGKIDYKSPGKYKYGSGARYRADKIQMSGDEMRRFGLENDFVQTYRGRRA